MNLQSAYESTWRANSTERQIPTNPETQRNGGAVARGMTDCSAVWPPSPIEADDGVPPGNHCTAIYSVCVPLVPFTVKVTGVRSLAVALVGTNTLI